MHFDPWHASVAAACTLNSSLQPYADAFLCLYTLIDYTISLTADSHLQVLCHKEVTHDAQA